MKRFLITYTYRLDPESRAAWHAHIQSFIAALASDPELKDRIRYRCLRGKGSDEYFHIAEALDDDAPNVLATRDWFKRYTEETKRVSGGTHRVVPLETIAETT